MNYIQHHGGERNEFWCLNIMEGWVENVLSYGSFYVILALRRWRQVSPWGSWWGRLPTSIGFRLSERACVSKVASKWGRHLMFISDFHMHSHLYMQLHIANHHTCRHIVMFRYIRHKHASAIYMYFKSSLAKPTNQLTWNVEARGDI